MPLRRAFLFAAGLLTLATLSFAGTEGGSDCNANGVEDDIDIASGSSEDCDSSGIPDECDIMPSRFALEAQGRIEVAPAAFVAGLGELEGDGDLDLFLVSRSPPRVMVLPNRGDGTFADPVVAALPTGQESATMGDLDGDGDTDLALAGSFGASVMFNLPGGVFEAGERIQLGSGPVSILAGDFDGDGLADLLTANSIGAGDTTSVSVLINMGGAAFLTARNYAAGRTPVSMVSADMDADGDLDLVIAHSEGEGLSWLRNDGTGAFPESLPLDLPSTPQPLRLAAGDLDGDRHADLLVTYPFQKVEILFNAAGVAPPRGVSLDIGMAGEEAWIGDLDGDGGGDIVIGGRFSPSLWVFLARGKGLLKLPLASDAFRPILAVESGDIDGDADLDLAVFSTDAFWMAFQERVPASADSNGNGIPDSCEEAPFLRGDSTADGRLDLSDAVSTLDTLFRGSERSPCEDAADSNDDGKVDLTDPVSTLLHLFQGGPAPPEPLAACGADSTPDPLSCFGFEACR